MAEFPIVKFLFQMDTTAACEEITSYFLPFSSCSENSPTESEDEDNWLTDSKDEESQSESEIIEEDSRPQDKKKMIIKHQAFITAAMRAQAVANVREKLNHFKNSFKELKLTKELFSRKNYRSCQENYIISCYFMKKVSDLCPQLEELVIPYNDKLPFQPQIFPPTLHLRLSLVFLNLKHLSKLELGIVDDYVFGDLEPFLSSLGECCPNLKYLNLCSFKSRCIGVKQALALGSASRQIFSSMKKNVTGSSSSLHLIQFDNECVTPICYSLEHFEMSGNWSREANDFSYAFLLRHMPKLKNLSDCRLNGALCLLQKALLLGKIPSVKITSFGGVYNEKPFKWTINSSPSNKDCHFSII